jgi:alcohol dehydrogenase class IV
MEARKSGAPAFVPGNGVHDDPCLVTNPVQPSVLEIEHIHEQALGA